MGATHTVPGEGNGNPLQYSCLEYPMEGGAWWAIVHGVTKSRTGLSDFTLLREPLRKVLSAPLEKKEETEKEVEKMKQIAKALKIFVYFY